MGGSSSKNKKEELKENKKQIYDIETNYKEKEKEKKRNENNTNNLKEIINISNDIEELCLDKNGFLINEKDITNSQENLINETTQNNIISLMSYENIIKQKEEIIIPYSEKESQKIITSFYDDFIEILNCFNSRKTFISLVKSLNEKHLFNFNSKKFPKTKESQNFLEHFKYSSIIIVCFIFLVKDHNLYESSAKKIKENLDQFIFACLDNIDRSIIFSLKIINFVQKYRKIKKSLFGSTSSIIKILFKNKSSYKHILNCLEQILNNINNESTYEIIKKINESILFCYNASNMIASNINISNKNEKINTNPNTNISFKNTKNKNIKNIKMGTKNLNNFSKFSINKNIKIEKNENNINNNENKENKENNNENDDERKETESVNAPFIKKELDKKFCLVLDIDETLSHMIKLPFGNYFLVRPGVIDLLKELYTYYEIDIFTAALKHYADNILNKLDRDNRYISYRLYRCHCTYEDGKSVKKLSLIGRDLNKIVFVDDLKRNAKYNMKNLALVSKWIDNIYDNEIINLKNKLEFIALCGKYDEDITRGLIEEKLTEDNKES